MRIGAAIPLDRGVDDRLRELQEMGMDSCQLVSWDGADQTEEMAALASGAAAPFDILPAVWLSSVLSVAAGLLMARVLGQIWGRG